MPTVPATPNRMLLLGGGELGLAVARGLAESDAFASPLELTVLLRPLADLQPNPARARQSATLGSLGARIIRADLASNSKETLATIFAHYTTVICCTGFVGGPGTQRRITAAVLEAGVKRYVPWQFGVDYDVVGRGSGQEAWDEQLDVRDMLRAQDQTRWTIVSTGIFTSFLFEPSFGVVDLAANRVNALGDWQNRITVTSPDDIGRLTAAILAFDPPQNGVVHISGDTLSYEHLANVVEQELGAPVERAISTTDHLRADLADDPGDTMRQYRLAFARDTGVAWDKQQSFNARHNIPVVDVQTWLRRTRLSSGNFARPTASMEAGPDRSRPALLPL